MTRASAALRWAQTTVTFWALITALILFLAMYCMPRTLDHMAALVEDWGKPELVEIEPIVCFAPELPTFKPVPWPRPYSNSQLRFVKRYTSEKTAVAVLNAVHKVSAERGLDPRVVLAIIKPESTFDPLARTAAGDHGLMQIRVRYHHDRMKRLGVTNIYDIESNIRVGVDIVLDYQTQAKGNLLKALTRYTGGSVTKARTIINLSHRIPA